MNTASFIIGLGNPGKKYQHTRHNVGKTFASWLQKNQLQKEYPFVAEKLEIIQSANFMNNSGEFVYNICKNYNDCKDYKYLFIVHDDLDIPLGKFKIQFAKGPKNHKGLLSIYQALGTKKFWHLRLGIDNRDPDTFPKESGDSYTLKPFRREEKRTISSIFPQIEEKLDQLIADISSTS